MLALRLGLLTMYQFNWGEQNRGKRMIGLGTILYLIIWVLVGALLTWVIDAYLPLDARIKLLLKAIVWIIIIWQILALLGVLSGFPLRA